MSGHGHSFHKKDWAITAAVLAAAATGAGAAGIGPLSGLLGGEAGAGAAGADAAATGIGAGDLVSPAASALSAPISTDATTAGLGADLVTREPLELLGKLQNVASDPRTLKTANYAVRAAGLLGNQPQVAMPAMPRGAPPIPSATAPYSIPPLGVKFDPQIYASLSDDEKKKYLALTQGGMA